MPFQKGNQLWRKATHKGQGGWNRGLTKEDNASLKRQSESLSKHWKEAGHPKGLLGKHHSEETKRKMSLARQGSKNANWRGGLTELIKGIRRSPKFYQWRKAVLERDNHICQDCRVTENLDAHHIQSIMDYPEGVFEVDNGLTLCKDCHKRHTWWQRIRPKKRRKMKLTLRKSNG